MKADQLLSVSVAAITDVMIKFTTYLLFGDSQILIGTIGNKCSLLSVLI
jgi:hypothetical protein